MNSNRIGIIDRVTFREPFLRKLPSRKMYGKQSLPYLGIEEFGVEERFGIHPRLHLDLRACGWQMRESEWGRARACSEMRAHEPFQRRREADPTVGGVLRASPRATFGELTPACSFPEPISARILHREELCTGWILTSFAADCRLF